MRQGDQQNRVGIFLVGKGLRGGWPPGNGAWAAALKKEHTLSITIQVFCMIINEIRKEDDLVTVVMRDMTNPKNPEEEAEIPLLSIPEKYRKRGMTFDMKITYEFNDHEWTKEEEIEIKLVSEKLKSLLGIR